MDRYSTHLPVLEEIIINNNIKTVFEFGLGSFSTNLFCKNCDYVVSCEMQSNEWYEKIKNEFYENNNLNLKCIIGPYGAINYLSQLNQKFDLIFVDGHGDTRWHAINVSSKYTDIIVSHDTETPSYRWDLISLDSSWHRKDYKLYDPWTTVWRKQ